MENQKNNQEQQDFQKENDSGNTFEADFNSNNAEFYDDIDYSKLEGLENENIEHALNANFILRDSQEKLETFWEIKKESYSPQERLELNQNSLESCNENLKVQEALEKNLELKAKQEELNKLYLQKEFLEKQEKAKEQNSTQQENTQNTQQNAQDSKEKEHSRQEQNPQNNHNDDLNEDLFNSTDSSELDAKIKALAEKVKDDKQNLENIIRQFSAKDASDLLVSLYKLDNAIAELMQNSQMAKENHKERESELYNIVGNEEMKDFILKGVNELTDKYIQVNGNTQILTKQKEIYTQINLAMDKGEKEKVQEHLETINKDFPLFKEHYHKTFQRAQSFVKEKTQEQTQQNAQSQTQGQSR